MRKKILRNLLAISGVAVVLLQSCKDDSKLTVPLPAEDVSFTESFDNFQEAVSKGWVTINKSNPLGPILYDVAEVPNFGSPNYVSIYYPRWEQAQLTLDSLQFPNAPYPQRYWNNAYFSQRGANGYVASSAACSRVWAAGFTVNSWLISPQMLIKNGDKISFYTFCRDKAGLELYINPTGTLNVGNGDGRHGDFIVKQNLNLPNLTTDPHSTYPTEWTKFTIEVEGLDKPVKGRFGFRYFVDNHPAFKFSTVDPNNLDTIIQQVHKTVVGLDELSYSSAQ